MKKFWKLSVCALAATFTLSSVTACGEKGETEEKSNITADQVLAIGDSIQTALSDVQSFSFGMTAKAGSNNPQESTENSMNLMAVANVKAEGIDAKLAFEGKNKASYPSMPQLNEDETFSTAMYILDGFAYAQDESDPTKMTYIKSSRPIIDSILEDMSEGMEMDLSAMLEEMMGNVSSGEITMPEIPVDFIKEVLNDEFILIQKGDTTRVTLDLKKEFNEIFSFVGNLSTATKIGDIANFALKYIDEELTWQDFTGALKGKGDYTVGTVINVVDNELYNAAGVHLQDVKDMIFAEPGVYDALVQEMGKEMADTVVNTTVDQFKAEYGAMTFDDIIKTVSEDETATLDGMITDIETALSQMTLGNVMDFESATVLNQITSKFKGIRMDDLNANLIFTVSEDQLTRVEVSFNFKITLSAQGQSATTYMNYAMYAENFSNQAQTIALPTGSTVVIYCNDCHLMATENDYCIVCRAYRCGDCHDQNEHNG